MCKLLISRVRMGPFGFIATLALFLGAAVHEKAKAEPITIGIAIGVGTSLAVAIAYDQFTANYLALSFGYATPQPDANLVWKSGRNTAIATDVDSGPPGPPKSIGQAYTDVGYIWDTLDPVALSEGNYFNASRTYKNGSLKDAETGGYPPPAGASATTIKVDISNLPLQNSTTIDMHVGKTGSYNSIFGAGAKYYNGQWSKWDARSETDSILVAYLNGTLIPSSDSDIPNYFVVPTLYEMFNADETGAADDWFPYFLSAVSTAGTHIDNGKLYYNDFSFEVPLSRQLNASGSWYASVGALAQNEVPEPNTLALISLSGVIILGLRRHTSNSG